MHGTLFAFSIPLRPQSRPNCRHNEVISYLHQQGVDPKLLRPRNRQGMQRYSQKRHARTSTVHHQSAHETMQTTSNTVEYGGIWRWKRRESGWFENPFLFPRQATRLLSPSRSFFLVPRFRLSVFCFLFCVLFFYW